MAARRAAIPPRRAAGAKSLFGKAGFAPYDRAGCAAGALPAKVETLLRFGSATKQGLEIVSVFP